MLPFLPVAVEAAGGPVLSLPWDVWRPLRVEARRLERQLAGLRTADPQQRVDLLVTWHLATVLRLTLDQLPRGGHEWGWMHRARLVPVDRVLLFVAVLDRHVPSVGPGGLAPRPRREWASAVDRAERITACLRACAPPVRDVTLGAQVLTGDVMRPERLLAP